MAQGGTYKYDNKIFTSIKRLSEYCGVNEKTITKRLQKGMSIEEACNNKDLRCRYIKGKSIVDNCRDAGKDEWLVRGRMARGYSIEESINSPIRVRKQGLPIVVFGVQYKSIISAIRALGLVEKESTIRRKLRSGIEPDIAFKC